MNLSNFLKEARRAQPIDVIPQDSDEKRRSRDVGDVGPVDRLTQLDKDKPKKVTVRNVAGRMAQGYDRNIKGVDDGKPDQPLEKEVDRDYSKSDQYTRRVLGGGKLEPDQAEIDPKYDPDSPEYKGGKSKDTAKRMSTEYDRILQTGKDKEGNEASLDGVTAADREMRRRTQDAEAAGARRPLQVPGLNPVADTAYLRHGYQSSGLGLNKKINSDDLGYIFTAIRDDQPIKKKASKTGMIDKRGVEQTQQQRPTARDVENLDPEAEKLAAKDKAYLTPEVMANQKALRDGLDKQDAKAVQKLIFKHKVDDNMVQEFIDMYGYNQQKNSILMQALKGRGGTAPETARYGGNLGPEGKKYRNPDGTYDFTRMPKSLRDKAEENRFKAMIKTYLQQGARDAYAMHEGIRSIADMNLEHITSLEGEYKGVDDPSNWAWASEELNKLKSQYTLTGQDSVIEKQAQGPRKYSRDTLDTIGKTFDEFTQGDKELQDDLADLLGGNPLGTQRQTGIFSLTRYGQMTPEEREEKREIARQEGIPEPIIQKLLPDLLPDKKADIFGDSEFQDPNSPRIGGRPYIADPVQFEKDTTMDARDRLMKREVVQQIEDKYGKISRAERMQTPEYQAFLMTIKRSPGALPMEDSGDEM